LEKVLRGALIYLFLLAALRLTGRREIGQFSTFDLVVLLLLSNAIQNALLGDDLSITGAMITVGTMLALNRLISLLIFHSPRAEELFEGREIFLVRDGRVNEDHLRRERITHAELRVAAHKHDIFDADEVGDVILEPDGTLTVRSREDTLAETVRKLDALQQSMARVEAALADWRPR
ncbi:MAG: DUF421 domain-containing protein, partial [Chloroflexi bacterium]